MAKLDELLRLKQEHAAITRRLKRNGNNIDLRLRIAALAQEISEVEEELSATQRIMLRVRFRLSGREPHSS